MFGKESSVPECWKMSPDHRQKVTNCSTSEPQRLWTLAKFRKIYPSVTKARSRIEKHMPLSNSTGGNIICIQSPAVWQYLSKKKKCTNHMTQQFHF